MDDRLWRTRAGIFGGIADVYDAYRPGYPAEAVDWLVGTGPLDVLELGAGTGKLTADLVARGHRVVASDPSMPMLSRLHRRVGTARPVQATAEAIPLAPGSVDVVVAAQSFHWFDTGRALPEIARVLRPGGALAMVWNVRDESVPWVRRLSATIGSDPLEEPGGALGACELFAPLEERRFRFWQPLDRESLVGLVRSRSYVATLPPDERDTVVAKVGALYDEYGRGPDGMLLPYFTYCYRARVTELASYRRDQAAARADTQKGREPDDPSDGLLIDFH